MINLKEIESYKDFGRVLEIENGIIRALVTLDIGPRIIFFGFIGGENIMGDNRRRLGGRTDESFEKLFGAGKKWENLGGHRIWAAPEEWPLTYTPDDLPVTYEKTANGISFTSDASLNAGFAKTLTLDMRENSADMDVHMTIKNVTAKTRDYSVWALTVSANGGTLVIPMNTDNTVLLPNRAVIVWPYTDIKDSRYTISNKYAVITNPDEEKWLKLGFNAKKGLSYYFVHGDVFKKKYDTFHDEKQYVDYGCSFETNSCNVFFEIETLSPLETVAPGGEITHTEKWSLFKAENPDLSSDEAIDKTISSL